MQITAYLANTTPHASSHLILWTILFFFITIGIWAYHARLDEVTHSTGKVIPSRQVQVVQNLEGGIVSDILVAEGDMVKKRQVLLRIDDTRFASPYRESQLKSSTLEAKIARLSAEAQGKSFTLPKSLKSDQRKLFLSEQRLAQSRRQELETNIAVIRQQKAQKSQEIEELKSAQTQIKHSYSLAQQELKITAPLVKQGVMSEVDLLRLQREAADLKKELETTRLRIPRAKAAVTEAERKIEEIRVRFRTQTLTELNEIKAELFQREASEQALADRVTRTAVRSPVKGTVKRLNVTTIGGVVQPGMDLIEIVPLEDTLLIEARIRPADIAFLHPGQTAVVKFTAYDFATFGGLKAHLEHISADTILDSHGEAFFLIRLRTERNYLGQVHEPLPIIPGMTVNVDILTGEKSVLDYLLKPLRSAQEKALRER